MFDNETLLFKYNVDTEGNPISVKVDREQKQVSINGTIQMEFIPDEFNSINMLGDNNQQMYEVFNRDEITSNTYYVDYSSGTIYYDKSQFGKVKLYNYYSRGFQMIGSSRIYDEKSITGEIAIKTLQDIIDEGRKCLELIKSLGDAVLIINKLDQDIKNGTILHENLTRDIEVGTPLDTSLKSNIDSGNVLLPKLVDANNIATQKKQALDTSITQATNTNEVLTNTNQSATQTNLTLQQTIATGQDSVNKINATGNKPLIIGGSQFVNNEYTWNHGLGSENLTVTMLDSDTNEPLMQDYKIIDKNNILIRNSAEHPNIKVVLSASYYQGNALFGTNIEEFAGDSITPSAKKVRLKDGNGVVENPITDSDAVFMSDGTTKLTKKINDINSSLEQIVSFDTAYYKPKQKVVFIGDSTSDNATAGKIYERFRNFYTCVGGILEGTEIIPHGANGHTLQQFLSNSTYNDTGIDKAIGYNADIYVFSYGINNIRGGVNSPMDTPSTIKALMKQAIDRILTETKGNILLRIPNTFLLTDVGSKGSVSPNEKAQEYSNQLWEIYQSFKGYSPRVDIIDIPNLVFGRECKAYNTFMQDQLHPNSDGYYFIADCIADRISGTYNKELYDLNDYEVIMSGSIEGSAISNTSISFYTNSNNVLKSGDVVTVGNKFSAIITKALKNNNKWLCNYNTKDDVNKGIVKILRKKTKEITTDLDINNWTEFIIESKENNFTAYTVADLSKSNLGSTLTNVNVYARLEYFTKELGFNNVHVVYYLNNDPSNFAVSSKAIDLYTKSNIAYGEIDGYESSTKADVTGYKYAHIFVMFNAIDFTNVRKFQLRNCSFAINNKELIYNNWKIYNGTHKSTVKNNCYCNKTLIGYEGLNSILSANNIEEFKKAIMNTKTDKQYFIETVIPVSEDGLNLFETKIEYITDNTSILNIKSTFYFNDSPNFGDITNNISGDAKKETIIYNQYGTYFGSFYKDKGTKRYLHLLIGGDVSIVANNNIDFNKRLWINGVEKDISNNEWRIFNGEVGSTIKNSYNKNQIVTVKMLEKMGLI